MTPLRRRLFSPPNAVTDPGIDLRRVKLNVVTLVVKPPFVWPGNLCGEFWLPDIPIASLPNPNIATMASIKSAVSAVWRIGIENIDSKRHHRQVVVPRHVAIALCCHLTTHSLPVIGRFFGRRDHTTALHAKCKMQHHIDAVAAELPANAMAIEWARAMKRRIDG